MSLGHQRKPPRLRAYRQPGVAQAGLRRAGELQRPTVEGVAVLERRLERVLSCVAGLDLAIEANPEPGQARQYGPAAQPPVVGLDQRIAPRVMPLVRGLGRI